MKFSALSLNVALAAAAYNPNSDSDWSTLTPAAAIPSGALTECTSSFGIAVSKITDSAELSSISSYEATVTATTLSSSTYSSSSESSSDEASSSSSSSAAAATSTDISDYFNVVSTYTSSALAMTLNNTQLVDSAGRIGSIVANRQFQFDGPPPQAGAIYAAGWSITTDGNLAIGDNDVFFQCLSGTFYNLYDENIGDQCTAIRLQAVQFV